MTINWKYGAEEADGAAERHERGKNGEKRKDVRSNSPKFILYLQ